MSLSSIKSQSRSLSQPNCEGEQSATVNRSRSFRYTDFWNELVAAFRSEVQPSRHRRLLRVYDESFEAKDAVAALYQVLQVRSERELTVSNAVRLFRKFQEMNIIEDAQNSRNKTPLDDEQSVRLFRFVESVGSRGVGKENFENEGKLKKTPQSRSTKAESAYQLAVTASGEDADSATLQNTSSYRADDVALVTKDATPKTCSVRHQFGTSKYVAEPRVLSESLSTNYGLTSLSLPNRPALTQYLSGNSYPSANRGNEPERCHQTSAVEPVPTSTSTPFRDTVVMRLQSFVGESFVGEFAATVNESHVRHNCTHTTRCGLVTDLPRDALYPDWLLTTMRTLTASAPASRRSADAHSSSNLSANNVQLAEQSLFRGLESDCYGTVVRFVADEYARHGPLVPPSFITCLSSQFSTTRRSMRDDIDMSYQRRAASKVTRGRTNRYTQLSPIVGSPSVDTLPPRSKADLQSNVVDEAFTDADADVDRFSEVLRYALLTLLPGNRRKLYVLARFMNKLISFDDVEERGGNSSVLSNDCRLDRSRTNREVVQQSLTQFIFGSTADCEWLLRFVIDHYRVVFVVPNELRSLAVVPSIDSTVSLSTALSECSSASKLTFSSDSSCQPRLLQPVARTKPPIAPKPKIAAPPATYVRPGTLDSRDGNHFAVPALPTRVPSHTLPHQTNSHDQYPQVAPVWPSPSHQFVSPAATMRTARRAESLTQYDRQMRRSVCLETTLDAPRRTPVRPTMPALSFIDIRPNEDFIEPPVVQSQSAYNVNNQSYQSNMSWKSQSQSALWAGQSHNQESINGEEETRTTVINDVPPQADNLSVAPGSSGRSRVSRKTEEELLRLIDYVFRNEKQELTSGEREKRLKQFSQVYPQLYARYRGWDEQTYVALAGKPQSTVPRNHRRSSGFSSFMSKLSQTFLNK